MTTRTTTGILTAAPLAGLLVTAAHAQPSDPKMSTKDMTLAPCAPDAANSRDCHVHDKNTYLHLKPQHPAPGPHAKSEIRDYRQKERSEHRGK